tara:strand:+ start:114 stop:866 length:753 start_codon:yes stop_codon:yes gene_type:complete
MANEGKWIGRSVRYKNENDASWNKRKDTGWKYEGGKWVQYRGGKPTGRTAKNRSGTTMISALNPFQTEKGRLKVAQKQKEKQSKGGGAANAATRTTNKSKPKATWKAMDKAGVLDKKTKKTTKPTSKSTVHTRHYKTGKALGVMTRSQRRAYDKEAAGRTFESEVAKHEKSSGHGKAHLRETKYKASLRKSNKNKLKTQQAALKAGKIEREEQEWGPGGQPSASKQLARMKKKKKPWHSYLKTNLGHSLL